MGPPSFSGYTIRSPRRHARARSARDTVKQIGDASGESPRLSVVFDALLIVVFVDAVVAALGWRANAQLFPLVAALPGIPLVMVAAWRDWRAYRKQRPAGEPAESGTDATALRRGAVFYGWLLGVLLATLLIGQYLALLVYVVLYLRLWAAAGWRTIAIYTVSCGVFLYLLFNLVVPVVWYDSPFFTLFD